MIHIKTDRCTEFGSLTSYKIEYVLDKTANCDAFVKKFKTVSDLCHNLKAHLRLMH